MNNYSLLSNDKLTFKHPITNRDVTVYRIIAERDFMVTGTNIGVRAGHIGGFVESESNLSQDSNSWVAHNAKVFDDAFVTNCSVVLSNASVYGKTVLDQSMVNNWANVVDCEFTKSQAHDNSYVKNCKFIFSVVKNSCRLNRSQLTNSKVWGGANIVNSELYDTFVADSSQVKESKLTQCKIYGESAVIGKTLINVDMNEVIPLFQDYPPIPGDNTEF